MFSIPTYEKEHAVQTHFFNLELSEEQKRKNMELRSRVCDLLPINDNQKRSDCDLLYRFLVGRKWNVEAADASLRVYVTVREEQKFNDIIVEKYDANIESISPMLYGFDRVGCPVMWNKPDVSAIAALIKGDMMDSLLRSQIRAIEMVRFVAKVRQMDRCTLVLDLLHVNISSVNPMSLGFLRQLFKIMQEYYPEIMSQMLIFNAGWAVTGAWKVLRPFVDPRVQNKIVFFTRNFTLEAIAPYISADQVPPSLRGEHTNHGSMSSSDSAPDVVGDIIRAEVRRLEGYSGGGLQGGVVSPPARTDSVPLEVLDHSDCVSLLSPKTMPQLQESLRRMGSQENLVLEEDATGELYSFCSSSLSYKDSSLTNPRMQIGSPEALNSSCSKRDFRRPTLVGPQSHDEVGKDRQVINLTECTNDRVIGFSGQVPIGEIEQNIVYRGDINVALDMRFSSPPLAPTTLQRVMVGELLSEAGHHLHHCVIVCGDRRDALYMLRRSRIRRRVQVYRMLKGARVVTDNVLRHSVVGKKVKVAECVPHSQALHDHAAWMMIATDTGRNGEKICCAEKMDQTLIAYAFLAKKPLVDIFTLLMGVCRLWEGDLHPAARTMREKLLKVRTVFGMRA